MGNNIFFSALSFSRLNLRKPANNDCGFRCGIETAGWPKNSSFKNEEHIK
jgi:hypothetical protein